MKLLLLGASGGVGSQVRALAPPGRLRPFGRAEVPGGVRGDPTDAEALARAMEGVDAVVSCLGIRRRSLFPWSGLASPADFASASARAVVDAMRRAGVGRIVAVSAAGVGDSAARLNPVMRALLATSDLGTCYADLARMEAVYADSGLDWTAVRPVALTDGPWTGRVREVDAFGLRDAISRADVAHWLLGRVSGPEVGARTPQIAST